MPRKKPFRVGDKVVVINYRKWIAPPARTTVIESVMARYILIKGHLDPIQKSSVVHRTPAAESLGRYLDLIDRLEDSYEEEVHAATRPIREKYEELERPNRIRIKELYRDVENGL